MPTKFKVVIHKDGTIVTDVVDGDRSIHSGAVQARREGCSGTSGARGRATHGEGSDDQAGRTRCGPCGIGGLGLSEGAGVGSQPVCRRQTDRRNHRAATEPGEGRRDKAASLQWHLRGQRPAFGRARQGPRRTRARKRATTARFGGSATRATTAGFVPAGGADGAALRPTLDRGSRPRGDCHRVWGGGRRPAINRRCRSAW